MPEPLSTPSSWAPLRQRAFRALWIATVASNIGTWMHEVGEGWLMTTLAPSPVMVSLVQALSSFPMFLLALPAGAMADLVDRRRVLLWTQTWMAACALVLGTLTLAHAMSPWRLLALTFALSVGAAMNAPAWQAIVPELVGPRDLPAAVALNSMGFNISRAVGPALGGLMIAVYGPGATFLLNAVSFLGVVIVLYRWRRETAESVLPAERFIGALRSGLRYVRYAPALHAVFARSAVFLLCASSLWALLPLAARFELGRGAGGYGALLGSFGSGAVLGAAFLPAVKRRVPFDALAAGSTLIVALALAALGVLASLPAACAALFAAGGAWLTILSGFNVAVQTAVPPWVRARALAAYLLVFYASMTVGSMTWGAVASRTDTRTALLASAGGLVVGLSAMLRYRVRPGEGTSFAPSRHWAAPLLAFEPEADRGPVLVTVEYRIDPTRAREFSAVMRQVRRSRRRSGALRWGLWVDTADPGRYVESFVDASWVEHLRHHERLTAEDEDVEALARAFHRGPAPPRVTHLLAEPPRPAG